MFFTSPSLLRPIRRVDWGTTKGPKTWGLPDFSPSFGNEVERAMWVGGEVTGGLEELLVNTTTVAPTLSRQCFGSYNCDWVPHVTDTTIDEFATGEDREDVASTTSPGDITILMHKQAKLNVSKGQETIVYHP